MPTASQIIAALLARFGGSVTLTDAEIFAFGTKWPTRVQWNDDGTITLHIDPDQLDTNDQIEYEDDSLDFENAVRTLLKWKQ